MKLEQVRVGLRVRTVQAFANVPRGTQGVIDEMYQTGCMVAWDLPENPLPAGYTKFQGVSAVASGILRDGFDYKTELRFLMPVDNVEPEGAKDDNARAAMQAIAAEVSDRLPENWGFCVLTFPLGDVPGRVNYVANGNREDIIKVLSQFLAVAKDAKSFVAHIP